MGSTEFRFYVNPNVDRDVDGNLLIVTPHRLRFRHGQRIAVIEPRLPVRGERTWQCWVTNSIADDMREMLTDWGADGPGWEATGNEENGSKVDDKGGHSYHVTIIATFEMDAWTFPESKMFSQDELMKAQGFKPGAEAKAANALDAKLTAHLVAAWKAQTPMPAGRDVAFWLNPIANAMDRMEEIGGPNDGYYLEVMDWVAKEAARRAKVLRGNLSRTELTDKPQTFNIELEIDGDPNDAYAVIENLLDAGRIQRLVNSHNHADAGKLRVTSAVLK